MNYFKELRRKSTNVEEAVWNKSEQIHLFVSSISKHTHLNYTKLCANTNGGKQLDLM